MLVVTEIWLKSSMAKTPNSELNRLKGEEKDAIGSYRRGIKFFKRRGEDRVVQTLKHIQGEEKEHHSELKEELMDRAKVHLGGKKKPATKKGAPKKRVHEMRIHRTANRQFTAMHHFKPDFEGGPIPEPDEHNIATSDELAQHVKEHFPDEAEGAEEREGEEEKGEEKEAPSLAEMGAGGPGQGA